MTKAAKLTAKTKRLQVMVDLTTERVIRDMVRLGIHGTSQSEVAGNVIRQWLWQNQAQLRDNGILLTPGSGANPATKRGSPATS